MSVLRQIREDAHMQDAPLPTCRRRSRLYLEQCHLKSEQDWHSPLNCSCLSVDYEQWCRGGADRGEQRELVTNCLLQGFEGVLQNLYRRDLQQHEYVHQSSSIQPMMQRRRAFRLYM